MIDSIGPQARNRIYEESFSALNDSLANVEKLLKKCNTKGVYALNEMNKVITELKASLDVGERLLSEEKYTEFSGEVRDMQRRLTKVTENFFSECVCKSKPVKKRK